MAIIKRILKLATLISTAGFIGSVLIQIYARFFMESAPSWTEEASRFFFVYTMSFAAGLAIKGNYYVHFDMLFNRLNKKHQKIVEVIVSLVTVVLFVIMALFSLQLIVLGLAEKSPSLRLPMSFAFGSILVMALSIGLFTINKLLKRFKTS